MADKRLEDLPPHDRRGFFAAGLSRLLRPLADYVEERLPVKVPPARDHLRPPGAIPEEKFLRTCYRCGSCADSCPVDAIALLKSPNDGLAGTPQIDPSARACAMCDGLACMKACPSGALQLVDRFAIRIGLARVDERLCVRAHGTDCTVCIDRCPLGTDAIRLDDRGHVGVIDPAKTGRGCTGCGLCQEHCPTRPVRAIRVRAY